MDYITLKSSVWVGYLLLLIGVGLSFAAKPLYHFLVRHQIANVDWNHRLLRIRSQNLKEFGYKNVRLSCALFIIGFICFLFLYGFLIVFQVASSPTARAETLREQQLQQNKQR